MRSRGMAGAVDALIWIAIIQSARELAAPVTLWLCPLGAAALSAVLTTWRGGSIGKLCVGLRVYGMESCQPASARQAWTREIARALMALLPPLAVLDAVAALRDDRGRALHDRLGGTVVFELPAAIRGQ